MHMHQIRVAPTGVPGRPVHNRQRVLLEPQTTILFHCTGMGDSNCNGCVKTPFHPTVCLQQAKHIYAVCKAEHMHPGPHMSFRTTPLHSSARAHEQKYSVKQHTTDGYSLLARTV